MPERNVSRTEAERQGMTNCLSRPGGERERRPASQGTECLSHCRGQLAQCMEEPGPDVRGHVLSKTDEQTVAPQMSIYLRVVELLRRTAWGGRGASCQAQSIRLQKPTKRYTDSPNDWTGLAGSRKKNKYHKCAEAHAHLARKERKNGQTGRPGVRPYSTMALEKAGRIMMHSNQRQQEGVLDIASTSFIIAVAGRAQGRTAGCVESTAIVARRCRPRHADAGGRVSECREHIGEQRSGWEWRIVGSQWL